MYERFPLNSVGGPDVRNTSFWEAPKVLQLLQMSVLSCRAVWASVSKFGNMMFLAHSPVDPP